MEEVAPDLLIQLFGSHKKPVHTWPLVRDRYQAKWGETATWSPCSRYQALMIVVYDQDERNQREVIAELPLRIDLLLGMPALGETKRTEVKLSGGSVHLLRATLEITTLIRR